VSSASTSAVGAAKVAYILRTGLFAPTKEGAKSIGSIQLKEAVNLPAGSYINLYEAERKNDKSPVFTLTVKEGKLNPKK
jgi:hypothetical protein